jgi:hypothetical protein
VEELNRQSHNVARHFDAATLDEINEALRRFAALFPNVPLVALGLVAINCGSLVERGGDPAIAGPGLLERLPRLNETAADFYNRCRALAAADESLIDELRAALAADDAEQADELSPTEIIDKHVGSEGWQQLADRFGPVLYREHPASVLGHMSEELFRLGLIAHLSRSKSLRAAARSQPELLAGTLRCDEAASSHRSFLATMLQVLDGELLLVLHVPQRKGFDVRISGIADNFHLHTLLAGAIIGPPEEGWVEGEAPTPRAVAQCRDARIDRRGGDNVTGAFNLFNWTALQPDGSLPEGQGEGAAAHWIWNEGWPAEIVPFAGRRVVLLGPPPYTRYWRAGRQFQGMPGELAVEQILDASTVNDWLQRLMHAARQ